MGQYGSYDKYVVDKGAAVANPAAIALEAALNTVVLLSRPLMEPISVPRFGYQAVVALAYGGQTAEGKLTLYRYPGGDANTKVALQTIRLVDATAIGSVCYADVPNPVVPATLVGGVITVRARNKADMEVGDVVAIWITTAATGGGGIAGDFQPFFTFHPRAEVKLNQPLMVNLTP
jgi:hypothetical protein